MEPITITGWRNRPEDVRKVKYDAQDRREAQRQRRIVALKKRITRLRASWRRELVRLNRAQVALWKLENRHYYNRYMQSYMKRRSHASSKNVSVRFPPLLYQARGQES